MGRGCVLPYCTEEALFGQCPVPCRVRGPIGSRQGGSQVPMGLAPRHSRPVSHGRGCVSLRAAQSAVHFAERGWGTLRAGPNRNSPFSTPDPPDTPIYAKGEQHFDQRGTRARGIQRPARSARDL